jgi:hypothetical protein
MSPPSPVSPNLAPASPVVLFGSGETSSVGRKAFDWVFRRLAHAQRPHVAILETPAGFQPNSAWVASQVADFLKERLAEFSPQSTTVPARERGTPLSPDNAEILGPLLTANTLYLGAGSPTYAVEQLRDSLAWHMVVGRQRLGAGLVLSSAAVLAASSQTLPVYEIYKVGERLHWKPGLDFFGAYGLELVFVPHWNNTEGGANLDTCFCFMGGARFEKMVAMLPETATILGIDEHTALTVDLQTGAGQVIGAGQVTVLSPHTRKVTEHAHGFDLADIGPFRPANPAEGLPPDLWASLQADGHTAQQASSPAVEALHPRPVPPDEVMRLVDAREAARQRRDWLTADKLRNEVLALGWQIQDTATGAAVKPR